MTDAAQETTAEEAPMAESQNENEEMPDFNIYTEEETAEPESQNETEVARTETRAEPDTTWSARVKKDRQLRKKEIEFKRREHSLAARESQVASLGSMKEHLLKDPSAFLESQGINPMEFYSDWTTRLATGDNNPSENLRISATEQELKALKQELIRRDQVQVQRHAEVEQTQAIHEYYGQIENFKQSTEEFPLTNEQCTAPEIAEGIASYYEQTGIELSFPDAFRLVEEGLKKKENTIFNDPSIVAKFKEYHGLDASNKDRQSHITLSNNLQTQPTKTPAEDMTDEEIHEFWKGKLFT